MPHQTHYSVANPSPGLSEEQVQDAFHSYLKSSLTQAKVEGLLPANVLSSAEGDLMITGPALCLYFAALRSTTEPPSVPLPRRSKTSTAAFNLSEENCPPTFRPFWLVWSHAVPEIQALTPEHQHDLARIICNLPPIAVPSNSRLCGIAADLRAVAIEISMRRTFQDRYVNDLQAALDAGTNGRTKMKASFVPPPSYDAPASASPKHSPSPSLSHHASFSPMPPSPTSPKPTILAPDAPAIEFIRETLYAALADVIERMPSLRRALRRDPTRAYFAAVAFAILSVATSSVTHPARRKSFADVLPSSGANGHAGVEQEATIYGVLDKTLLLSQCPPDLRPFMAELCAIGRAAHEMEEQDSVATVQALERGEDPPLPRLDRARDILEGGVGHAFDGAAAADVPRAADHRRRTTSTENRAVAFANRINALALGMTRLRAFRERQDMVFKVLAGVGG
ncbi:uncharacterized protein B0H18DRAFT_1031437 [Fomitopsis serialis]|uniref:uncharacterized protein n=1 Tax=Fomitopsis serialis TaxID=139415 RepID=UPI0020087778|nr:uncharacterized protein B0H18DRAFT_1031437 [Neoantrodia serialis]KAH9918293.1 hypothetical protein B0H18DRAFT_1031437 [Neoantrodia serialis]